MLPVYIVKGRSYASDQISVAFLKNGCILNSQLLDHMPSEFSGKQNYFFRTTL